MIRIARFRSERFKVGFTVGMQSAIAWADGQNCVADLHVKQYLLCSIANAVC